jgi:hypothetical protein
MSSRYPRVWFFLLDSATGQPYKNTTADYVSLPCYTVIAQFREAVKEKDKDDGDAAVLTPFKSSQLLVYKNKAAFDKRNAVVDKGKEVLENTFIQDLVNLFRVYPLGILRIRKCVCHQLMSQQKVNH